MSDINIDPLVFTLAAQTEEESYGEQFEIVSSSIFKPCIDFNYIYTKDDGENVKK